jgi:hypothetical protein
MNWPCNEDFGGFPHTILDTELVIGDTLDSNRLFPVVEPRNTDR